MFVSVVGFSGEEQAKSPSFSSHRGVRRQRSLLTSSLRSTSSISSMSRADSISSMGSGELVGSYSSSSEGCESEDASAPCGEHQSRSQLCGGIAIPYTRCVHRCLPAAWVWVTRFQRASGASRASGAEMQKALRFAISLQRALSAGKRTHMSAANGADCDGRGGRVRAVDGFPAVCVVLISTACAPRAPCA